MKKTTLSSWSAFDVAERRVVSTVLPPNERDRRVGVSSPIGAELQVASCE